MIATGSNRHRRQQPLLRDLGEVILLVEVGGHHCAAEFEGSAQNAGD